MNHTWSHRVTDLDKLKSQLKSRKRMAPHRELALLIAMHIHEQQVNGEWQFKASACLYVKAQNDASFFSHKNTYLEELPQMRKLYPKYEWETTGPTAKH